MAYTKTIAVILYSLVLLGCMSILSQTMASPSSVATTISEITELSTKTEPTATETKTIIVPTAHSSTSNPLHTTSHHSSITPTSTANKPSFGAPAFDMPRFGFVPSFVFASLAAVGFVMALV
ncbi:hypothetical protein BC937DRAFT_86489 [Endogone sp. FLAS-F59071]|nr:hypothetical protein BC937DRAFT_86489 [Endogone sp. FLAS-F59071]|eukprot:RUS20051.1 hypothetical protein BC937DRAFT_86489 [Endogone sp. FLAS-F59071]